MMSVTIFLVAVIVVHLLKILYKEYRFRKHLKNIPGPKPLPIIGNSHLFKSLYDYVNILTKMKEEHGGRFIIYFGWRPRLYLCEAKYVELLLKLNETITQKSYEYSFLGEWIGNGLLTSFGQKWKAQRQLLNPAFNLEVLKKYIPAMEKHSDKLILKLQKHAGGQPFDTCSYISLYALDIICDTAMGTNIKAQEDPNSTYVRYLKHMGEIVTLRSVSPLKMFNLTYKFTSTYKLQNKVVRYLHEYTNSIIQSRREMFGKNNNRNEGVSGKEKLSFLDLLLQHYLAQEISEEEFRNEVDTFMFAGHDTVSSALSFALYCLAQNTDVQQRVVDELESVCDYDEPLTYNNIREMRYLEMVIKEVIRLYPPAPLFSRILNEDIEFEGNILPKGLIITVNSYSLHQDPNVFPHPERFDPNRFSAENCATRSPYAYVPFSAGIRNCIGQRLAMIELKLTVCKVLKKYELLPVPEHKPYIYVDPILKSQNGLPIRIKIRNS